MGLWGAGWDETCPSLSGGSLGVSPWKAEVLGDISWACVEELREAHSTPSLLSASAPLGQNPTHAGWLWACYGNPLLLSWALPGQNGGGETEVDSPHQEAHSGQPPYHHPPEGEFLGRLMGAGSGCPSEPAPGNPGPHLLDTGPPQCRGPLYQPCGGPWCDRAEEEMAHSKVATRWVSFSSRPKKPSWKWIPIVSSPFLPALSLTVLVSWSDCILGELCWILRVYRAGRMGAAPSVSLGVYCETRAWC